MKKPSPTRRPKPSEASEEGYMLIAVIFLVTLLTIALSVALPKMSRQIQRDRDLETMNRGKQYARAVRMYYKKFGGYPPNVDVLVKPVNNIRFLRKKYSDPTTGKEDWKPIPVGMNKAPTVMGFFGQPLGGTGGCAANTMGGGSATPPGQPSGSPFSSSSSGTGPGSTGSSTNGGANCGTLNLSSSTGTPNPDGTTTDPNAANASGTSSTSGSTTGQTGQLGQIGGGPLMGFSPNSPKKSIMVYKTKSHYNEWEFVYDPIAEQMQAAAGVGGAGNGLPGSTGIGTNPNPGGPSPNPNPSPNPVPSPGAQQ
ncbi:MAG: hypothetical protein ABR907_03780 [Terracidiphilus sp.]|jgi:type II secretory pathway pseudopilin PulG